MRKKQEIEETRRERDRLREENQKLSAKLEHCMNTEDKLRAQLEKLKMELVEHAQCSVSLKKRNSGVIQYPVWLMHIAPSSHIIIRTTSS